MSLFNIEFIISLEEIKLYVRFLYTYKRNINGSIMYRLNQTNTGMCHNKKSNQKSNISKKKIFSVSYNGNNFKNPNNYLFGNIMN